ncbi:MAG: extracellular solute-binding protein [Oscillospiraceae bacterium]|jgi:raffinose/stachyose/melibiose transport system substrate-binding protein|nr:extracellular solute-binding protein [Oscillospiraceae bacterium]
MNRKESRPRIRTALLALALCAALAAGFLAGCNMAAPGGEKETTLLPPAEETGLKLNLYQPHPAQEALWQALAADYKNLTGVDVAVISPKGGAPATELKEALKGERDRPAIFLFANPREYKAWQEHAMDITGNAAYQRLVDRRLALTAGGKTVAMPVGVEAFGIICNRKVLDDYFVLEDKKSGLKSVAEVKTYKELEALAKDIHERRADLGIDGAFAAPALKEGEGAAWTTRLLSVPLGYEIEKARTDVTGDKVDEIALRHESGYRGFYDLHFKYGTAAQDALENRAYADAVKEFATGKAAFILGGTDFLGHLNSTVGQTVSAEQCAFLPAFMDIEDAKDQGLAFEAVEYAAVNGSLDEEGRQAAGEFLDWLFTSEKGMDFLANKLNVLAPYDSVTEAALPNNPLSASAFEWLRKEGVTGPVVYSVLAPGEEFRDKVMARGLTAYARGESEWKKFRTDLKEGWAEFRAKVDERF